MRQAFRRQAINLPLDLWALVASLGVILAGSNLHDPTPAVSYGPPSFVEYGLLALELLSTLGSSKRRALHDLLAGSVVIRLSALATSRDELAGAMSDRSPLAAPVKGG